MQFTDTHCHIHSADYPLLLSDIDERAIEAGVNRLICVGTDEADSELAVKFVQNRLGSWASVGLHPHDAVNGAGSIKKLRELVTSPKVVAIGECGLDYFYDHSPREQQITMFKAQIELALEHNLPLIFHVREAFDDFWPIFDKYRGIRGVLHSFTDTQDNLDKALERGLYIGVNGIATFTKIDTQKDMYKSIPIDRLLLETDAPFLTPIPLRGSINQPAYVALVAKCLADLRTTSLQELSRQTSQNATKLFSL